MNGSTLQWECRERAITLAYRSYKDTMQPAILRTLPLFRGLSDDDLRVLLAESCQRSFAAGEILYYQGESGATCHIVLQGRVRIFVVAEDGRELAVRILGPGEIVGEMALFEDLPRSANVEALEPTQTVELDEATLNRCLHRSPGLAMGLLRALSSRLRSTTEDAEGLVSLPVPERLLRQLRRLAVWSGQPVPGGIRIVPPMTQQELAALTGATRESVNRALNRLRHECKVRLQDGWIILLDAGLQD